MTKINIGMNPGPSIREVEIDKPFKEITATDVYKIAKKYRTEKFNIIGWADVTNKT